MTQPTPPDPPRTPDETDARGLPRRSGGTKTPVIRTEAQQQSAREFAIAAARSLRDDKCDDIIVLDLKGNSPVTAFFVIASGTSPRQMRTAGRSVEALGEATGMAPFRHNLREHEPTWVIIDCVDVVVHIFEPETRAFYDLEMLWNDAERVPWDDGKGPSRAPRDEEPDPEQGEDAEPFDDEAITEEDYAAASAIPDEDEDDFEDTDFEDDEFEDDFDEDDFDEESPEDEADNERR